MLCNGLAKPRRSIASSQERSPAVFDGPLAITLNNLANASHTPALGLETLKRGRQAVSLYQRLHRTTSAFFAPGLARAISRPFFPAWLSATLKEAIKVLCPGFCSAPEVFFDQMRQMDSEYLRRCGVVGKEPDLVVLDPVVKTYERFKGKPGRKSI